ncbi:MAG: amino acid adenylation domain-containing protein, partial [bacterium]|nr:amino acid adenylation domain-containing protein [bacterium]
GGVSPVTPEAEIPIQVVHEQVSFKIERFKIEISHSGLKDNADIEENQLRRAQREFFRTFDLGEAPLLRIGIVETTEAGSDTAKPGRNKYMLIDMHHIITDGTSLDILTREFFALDAGKRLPTLKRSYRDYAEWQSSSQQRQLMKQQEEYWIKEYSGEMQELNLPTDYPRPVIQAVEGNTLQFTLNKKETENLKEIARERKITLYMTLLSIYTLLLSKLSGREDIIVGTPTAGRQHACLENIIGMFINTLPIRNYPAGKKTFKEYLTEVKGNALQAFENQEYQFEDLVDRLSVRRDTGRNPIFDVMFNLINQPEYQKQNQSTMSITSMTSTSKFDLTLNATEEGEHFNLYIEYCTKLFKEATIKRFITYFKEIVRTVSGATNQKISNIEIITEEEKHQILYEFNDTAADYPRDKTIHQLFEEQVERTPGNIGLVGSRQSAVGKEKTKEKEQLPQKGTIPDVRGIHESPFQPAVQITYRELNEKSNRLAYLLQSKGVEPGTIVAIMLERSIEMIIGLMGILKAGAAYLPIDPEYPRERINYMLKDSNAGLLLVDNKSEIRIAKNETKPNDPKSNNHPSSSFPNNQYPITNTQTEGPVVLNLEHLTFEHLNTGFDSEFGFRASDLAYIIYTSGTTGKPKGVMVEHRNVVNVVRWFARTYTLKHGVNMALMSNITFDASVNQVYGTLLHGASLHVLTKELLLDLNRLRDFIRKNRINIINFVPSLINELLNIEGKLKSLQTVLSGAEKLKEHIKNMILRKGYHLYNQYGPTETTIDALTSRCTESQVTLGTPIDNIQCLVMDKYRNLLPVGVTGELFIAGAGVSRGYLNRPELTTEKFIKNPFPDNRYPITNTHLYASGDLVRWQPTGKVEYLGRIDHQVKIRGYRIELGEIESRLLTHPEIKEAVVLDRESKEGEKFLCAYYVENPQQPTSSPQSSSGTKHQPSGSKPPSSIQHPVSSIQYYLAQFLPDYMIPSFFINLERIPLTSNGKIDRKALTQIQNSNLNTQPYTGPRNEIEHKLAEIWADILDRKTGKIGIDEDFFHLGGHSLKATIMASRIHKEFDVKLPLAEIFKTPSIRSISENIKKRAIDKHTAIEPTEKKEYYTLSSPQKRLYILQQMELESTTYNMPHTLPLAAGTDIVRLENTFRQLIQRHESLRTSFHMINPVTPGRANPVTPGGVSPVT